MLAQNHEVLIVGANLNGLLLAATLINHGVHVTVIDDAYNDDLVSDEILVLDNFTIASLDFLHLRNEVKLEILPVDKISIYKNLEFVTHVPLTLSQENLYYSLKKSVFYSVLQNYLALHCCSIFYNVNFKRYTEENSIVKCLVDVDENEIELLVNRLILISSFQNAATILNDKIGSKSYFEAEISMNDFTNEAKLLMIKSWIISTIPLENSSLLKVKGFFTGKYLSEKSIKLFAKSLFTGNQIKFISLGNSDLKSFEESFNSEMVFKLHFPVCNAELFSWKHDINYNAFFIQNFAWKFCGIIKCDFSSSLLSSIHLEFNSILFNHNKAITKFLRELKYFRKFQFFIHSKNEKIVLEKMLTTYISNKDLNFRESLINLNLSDSQNFKAGDILPNKKIYLSNPEKEIRLYDWCKSNLFTVLVIGNLTATNAFSMARWIKLNYPLAFYYIERSEKNEQLFQEFSIAKGERKMLLIRPDKIIGLIAEHVDVSILDNYLATVLGMRSLNENKKAFNTIK